MSSGNCSALEFIIPRAPLDILISDSFLRYSFYCQACLLTVPKQPYQLSPECFSILLFPCPEVYTSFFLFTCIHFLSFVLQTYFFFLCSISDLIFVPDMFCLFIFFIIIHVSFMFASVVSSLMDRILSFVIFHNT